MDSNEMMTLRALDGGFSPYEQVKVGYMQQKNHTSGIGVAGLVLGTVGTAVGVGAWLFGGMYGNAKANQAKEVANAAKEIAGVQINATQRQLDQLTNLLAVERNERLQGQTTISQTITDSISGQQQGSQSLSNNIENSALAQATAQIMAGVMTGGYSQNAQKVALVNPETPFQCGCGCNG